MTASTEFKTLLLAAIPRLRVFAMSLVHDEGRADDLTQEALVKAWANREKFQPGTNLPAWLCTIMRNEFYSQMRMGRREVRDEDGRFAGGLSVRPGQQGSVDLADFRAALAALPDDQREAVVLVGASGFSYDEAAAICGCPVGTMKSRVSRARNGLAAALQIGGFADYGPDSSERSWRSSAPGAAQYSMAC